MNRTPEQRLEKLREHALKGWELSREHPVFRDRARNWLEAHPSGWPEVDRLWQQCLDGEGPLAAWLDSGAVPSAWQGFPALHSILSSHPFPGLLSWSIRQMSRAS